MKTLFSSLHQLAVANATLCTRNIASEEEHEYQWYVTEIDLFIAGIHIEELRDEFSKLNVSDNANEKLHTCLNKFTLIWNEWKGYIHNAFCEVCIRIGEVKVTPLFNEIIELLQEIQKRPEDKYLKEDFKAYVESANRKIKFIREEMGDLLYHLSNFIKTFEQQRKILEEICQQVYEEENIKEENIKKIEHIIDDYNDQIKDLKNSIIALGVLDGIGVLGTAAALIGAFFTSGATLTLLVPCLPIVGCTSYMIDKYRKEISRLKSRIDKEKKKSDTLDEEIVGLIAFSDTIKSISKDDETIEKYVVEVKKPWDALYEDLNEILADIAIQDDCENTVYEGYLQAFKDARDLWEKTFMPEIKKLKPESIKVVTPPEDFSIETEEDWNEAVKKYSVSIEEYFRNIA